MEFEAIAKQIIELKNKDLSLRNELVKSKQLSNGYNKSMEKLHTENAQKLNKIIDEIGYPTIDKVGKEGSEAAWLIIQHSIGHSAFMKKCARLLKNAVQEKKANPINLAYLTDRIAVFEGKAQAYGTQFDWDEKGEMSPNVFDDLDKVNERRKLIGLNTLQEQTKIMREQVLKEHLKPPVDFLKRKNEIDEWKKSVGWKK